MTNIRSRLLALLGPALAMSAHGAALHIGDTAAGRGARVTVSFAQQPTA